MKLLISGYRPARAARDAHIPNYSLVIIRCSDPSVKKRNLSLCPKCPANHEFNADGRGKGLRRGLCPRTPARGNDSLWTPQLWGKEMFSQSNARPARAERAAGLHLVMENTLNWGLQRESFPLPRVWGEQPQRNPRRSPFTTSAFCAIIYGKAMKERVARQNVCREPGQAENRRRNGTRTWLRSCRCKQGGGPAQKRASDGWHRYRHSRSSERMCSDRR